MYQIDNSTAVQAIPASTSAGSKGYFTDGNPATGTPATILPAEFMNMLMMENLNVLAAAGIVPDKTKFNQLALAISAITGSNLNWANLGGKPTTVAGFGITDVYTKSQADALLLGKANKATTLAGYNITDAIQRGAGGYLGTPAFLGPGRFADYRESQLMSLRSTATTDLPAGVTFASAIHTTYPANIDGDKFAFDLLSSMTANALFYRRVLADGTGTWNEIFTTGNFNPALKADVSTVNAALLLKADAAATTSALNSKADAATTTAALATCIKRGEALVAFDNPKFGSNNTPSLASGPTVNTGAPEISNVGNAAASAVLLFQRVGVFAGYLGLDTDNQLKWGGGSYGANAYTIYHQGNLGQATETSLGTVKVATQLQINNGIDDSAAVTSKKIRLGFFASLTTNGYIVFPQWLGSFMIQWGRYTVAAPGGSTTAVSFPIPFGSSFSPMCWTGVDGAATDQIGTQGITTTGMTISKGSADPNVRNGSWFAFGGAF